MKNFILVGQRITLLVFAVILLTACPGEEPLEPITAYAPVLMKREQLEKSIRVEAPKPMYSTGKIFVFENYLLVNEPYEGIHVIDNTNPSKPVEVKFIRIPGNIDIALKGSNLMVDNAVDLVSIDVSDLNNIHEVGRVRNTFPELTPPDRYRIPEAYLPSNRPDGMLIIGWKKNS